MTGDDRARAKSSGEKVCPHDHIRHENKSRTICKDCGIEMVRFRGGWIGKGETGSL